MSVDDSSNDDLVVVSITFSVVVAAAMSLDLLLG